ncbi:MAG: hypothetical protein AAF830_15655 [Pseudomonadota bacterium]
MPPPVGPPITPGDSDAKLTTEVLFEITARIHATLFLEPDRDFQDVVRDKTNHLPPVMREAVLGLIALSYQVGKDNDIGPVLELQLAPPALPNPAEPVDSTLLDASEIRDIADLLRLGGMAQRTQDVDVLLSGLDAQLRSTLPDDPVPANPLILALYALNSPRRRNGNEFALSTVLGMGRYLVAAKGWGDVAEKLSDYIARIADA